MGRFAMKSGADRAGGTGALAVFCLSFLLLAGCSALPDKPHRTVLYDFGPGPLAVSAPPAVGTAALPPITLADLDTAASRLEGTALNYRLGYADANELRPYAGSRWTQPPLQLFRQRLRDGLTPSRTVLGTLEAANLSREGRSTDVLRISLDEFSHYFESPSASVGLVRVRATLVRGSPAGERVLGQRVFTVRQAAPTNDAAGGVKALTAASDEAVGQMVAWVNQAR